MKTLQLGRRWQQSSVILLLIAAGCASPSERIARYITKHPERPAPIHASMQRNRVVVDMTPQEVRLSLGDPNRIVYGGTELKPTETWYFYRAAKKSSALATSSFWSLEVPRATIYFSADERVYEAAFYDVGKTKKPQAKTQRPTVATKAPLASRYTPTANEIDVKGWPKQTLSGLSAMGNNRSAILNDEVYGPGETVNGMTVNNVFANGVLLEYQGRRAFLRPGESTK